MLYLDSLVTAGQPFAIKAIIRALSRIPTPENFEIFHPSLPVICTGFINIVEDEGHEQIR